MGYCKAPHRSHNQPVKCPGSLEDAMFSKHIASVRSAATVFASTMTLMIVMQAAQAPQTFTVLHSFTGGADGANPAVGLTIDHSGTLYGTAEQGGNTPSNCGTTRG